MTLPTAKLAYLSEVDGKPGEVEITLEVGTSQVRAKLTPKQFANMVADGARYMRGYVEERA